MRGFSIHSDLGCCVLISPVASAFASVAGEGLSLSGLLFVNLVPHTNPVGLWQYFIPNSFSTKGRDPRDSLSNSGSRHASP